MTANDLTFGVEIECLIPRVALQNAGWIVGGYHNGAPIPGHAGWTAQQDGSLMPGPGSAAVEVVSGVLQGVAGIESLRRMTEQLKAMGAKVNASCGLHVHVGWNHASLTDEALFRLMAMTSQNELALLASTGTRTRDHNRYASSVKAAFTFIRNQKSLPTGTTRRTRGQFTADDVIGHGRYFILNLTNLQRAAGRRTVEFRVFAGTTAFKKISAYVSICLGLVVLASALKRTPEWDAKASTVATGTLAMKRLLQRLGWLRGAVTNHGVVGWMGTDREREQAVAELTRLAERYTAATTHRPSHAETVAREQLRAAGVAEPVVAGPTAPVVTDAQPGAPAAAGVNARVVTDLQGRTVVVPF